MSHIHVCLVSDQPIPNLTTVLQLKPDQVVLLSTDEMRRQTARLEKVIASRGVKVQVREILPYDVNNVISVCGQVIDDCAGCDVSLNITGGTKISTLGAYQEFCTRGKSICYVNTRDEEILQIAPHEAKVPIAVTIPIKDYLAAYGLYVESYTKDVDLITKREAATEALLDLALSRPELIGRINGAFPDNIEKAVYPIDLALSNDKDLQKTIGIIRTCLSMNLTGGNAVRVLDYDTARYLRGIWLEEYVYLTAKEISASEVKLNVEGKWEAPGKYTPKNEFDVLISKGVRLYFISCKTANPDRKKNDKDDEAVSKEYLYELDSLSDHALGLFGKKMLISARPITDDYVRKRANVLGISIADGKNLRTLKENLRQWLTK